LIKKTQTSKLISHIGREEEKREKNGKKKK